MPAAKLTVCWTTLPIAPAPRWAFCSLSLEGATFTSRELARQIGADMVREIDWHYKTGGR